MDIKEQITKVVEKISKDEKLQEQFKKEPVKAVESVLGVDLPDDIIEKVVNGVKGKIALDKIPTDKLSDAVDSFKQLF